MAGFNMRRCVPPATVECYDRSQVWRLGLGKRRRGNEGGHVAEAWDPQACGTAKNKKNLLPELIPHRVALCKPA
eukprot:498215-Rhodomonas_salina.1